MSHKHKRSNLEYNIGGTPWDTYTHTATRAHWNERPTVESAEKVPNQEGTKTRDRERERKP